MITLHTRKLSLTLNQTGPTIAFVKKHDFISDFHPHPQPLFLAYLLQTQNDGRESIRSYLPPLG